MLYIFFMRCLIHNVHMYLQVDRDEVLLNQGDTYCAKSKEEEENKGMPKNCKPIAAEKFVMMETIFLHNLR